MLIGYRQTWAFSLAKFLTDPFWWFYLFWLPRFFNARFSVDLSHLGLPLIAVYNASAIGSIGGGWLPALFHRRGMSMTKARLFAMFLYACAVVPIYFAGHTTSEWAAVGLLSLAASAHQAWSANLFSTTSDMFPKSAVGSVTGFGGMWGSIGGVLLFDQRGKDIGDHTQLCVALRHGGICISHCLSYSAITGSRFA